MAYLHPDILDAALQVIIDGANELHICNVEPTDFTEAVTTYSLGSKSAPTIGAQTNASPSGRKVTVASITDGVVTDDGTAAWVALVDTNGSRLLASTALVNGVPVSVGVAFPLSETEITFPKRSLNLI